MYRNFYAPSKFNPGMTMPEKFPEDIECVIKSNNENYGSVYISNVEAAQNPNTLRSIINCYVEHKIRSVLTCAKGHSVSHSSQILDHYKYIPALDHEGYELTPHF